jgi:hypothetical protein
MSLKVHLQCGRFLHFFAFSVARDVLICRDLHFLALFSVEVSGIEPSLIYDCEIFKINLHQLHYIFLIFYVSASTPVD